MISGRYTFASNGLVRNFGANLLARSVLSGSEWTKGEVVAVSWVRSGEVEVNLVRWNDSGKIIPLSGSSRAVVRVGRANSKGHIRDLAWASANVQLSRGTERTRRVLAIVTDETLLVFEVVFTEEGSIHAFNLVSNVDVDGAALSNSNDAKLLQQGTKICSTCSRISWHQSAIPTLFLFRASGPPIRVMLDRSTPEVLPRTAAEVIIMNIRDPSSDDSITTYGGTIAGNSLLVCSKSLGIVRCETPLIEKAHATRSRTKSTPAFLVSSCKVDLMCASDGVVGVVYTTDMSKERDRPLLELGKESSQSSLLGETRSSDNSHGKFRHVLAGESILSALSVTPDVSDQADLEVLRAGMVRKESLGKGILWREEARAETAATMMTTLGPEKGGAGPLSELMSISKISRPVELSDYRARVSTSAVTPPQGESAVTSRLRIMGVWEGQEGSSLPVLADIPLSLKQSVDLGCIYPMPSGTSLLFACAGKRAREIAVTKAALGAKGEGKDYSAATKVITLPEGLTARGLSMGIDSERNSVRLLVMAVAKVEGAGSLASHGAAASVEMCLLSYRVDDFIDQPPISQTTALLQKEPVYCSKEEEEEAEGGAANTDHVLIAAAASHHLNQLDEVADRRKILIEHDRAAELVRESYVEPEMDLNDQMYRLNFGSFDVSPRPSKTVEKQKEDTHSQEGTQALQAILENFSAPILEELRKQRQAIDALQRRLSSVEATLSQERNSNSRRNGANTNRQSRAERNGAKLFNAV